MKASDKKKKDQLGMSHGTAQHRLRKMIMFDLVQRLGENVCYRCGEKINESSELSIEHKVNFLDSDDPVKNFFSLDNITFSHFKCNIAFTRRTVHANNLKHIKSCSCKTCEKYKSEAFKITESGRKDKKEIIPALIMEGLSYREIEKEIGIGRQSIVRYMKKIAA